MNLREQEYICEIANCKSITRAAEKLNITQSALSSFIINIEKTLGYQLFERNGKKMIPTYEGELYLEYARQMLLLKVEYECRMADILENNGGRIRFGILLRMSPLIIPAILPQYSQKYPNIKVDIYEGDIDILESMLLENKIDYILSYIPQNSSKLDYEIVAKERYIIGIPEQLREKAEKQYDTTLTINLDILKNQKVMIYRSPSVRNQFEHFFKKNKIEVQIEEYRNMETMIQLTKQGYGCCILQEMYMKNLKMDDKPFFCSFGNEENNLQLCISYRKGMYIPNYAKQFLQLIKKCNTPLSPKKMV